MVALVLVQAAVPEDGAGGWRVPPVRVRVIMPARVTKHAYATERHSSDSTAEVTGVGEGVGRLRLSVVVARPHRHALATDSSRHVAAPGRRHARKP